MKTVLNHTLGKDSDNGATTICKIAENEGISPKTVETNSNVLTPIPPPSSLYCLSGRHS